MSFNDFNLFKRGVIPRDKLPIKTSVKPFHGKPGNHFGRDIGVEELVGIFEGDEFFKVWTHAFFACRGVRIIILNEYLRLG